MKTPHHEERVQPNLGSTHQAGNRTSDAATHIMDVAGMSHRGKVRSQNEDHFAVARFGRYLEVVHTNIPAGDIPARAEELGYGLVVADGVGGQSAGEVASRLAITVLWDLVLKTPDWVFRLENEGFFQEVARRAKERISKIDTALIERSLLEPQFEGMATTMTVAATIGGILVITHVGDSRAYLVRDSKLIQLTRDHTAVQELLEQKVIGPEEVATHRLRNVLTNALGSLAMEVEPDVQKLTLLHGDCLLLCTDGLSSYVDDKTILQALDSRNSADRVCQDLIGKALDAGGKDNITVIVGRYNSEQDVASRE